MSHIDYKINIETSDNLMRTQPRRGKALKFFTPSAMKFFNSKVYDPVYEMDDYWFFITSERDSHAPFGSPYATRYFTVRVMYPDGDIISLTAMGELRTKAAAEKTLKKWLSIFKKVWTENLDWAFSTGSANAECAPVGTVYENVRPHPTEPREFIADIVESKIQETVKIAMYTNQLFRTSEKN